MARQGITYDQVATAANALTGEGTRPTIQNIREHLGTGSPNTIHRHLSNWRAAQVPAERPTARLSDELTNAIGKEIEQHAAAARTEAETAAQEARAEADALADTGEGLEAEREAAAKRAGQAEAERDEITADRDRLAAELERVNGELDEARELAQQRSQQLADARARITSLEEREAETSQATRDEIEWLRGRVEKLESGGA